MSFNIDNIRDIEIDHVDLEEFIKRVREPPISYLIGPTINSEIHLIATFPMSAHNPKFVLALANIYDSTTTSIKDADRKKTLIKLD